LKPLYTEQRDSSKKATLCIVEYRSCDQGHYKNDALTISTIPMLPNRNDKF